MQGSGISDCLFSAIKPSWTFLLSHLAKPVLTSTWNDSAQMFLLFLLCKPGVTPLRISLEAVTSMGQRQNSKTKQADTVGP